MTRDEPRVEMKVFLLLVYCAAHVAASICGNDILEEDGTSDHQVLIENVERIQKIMEDFLGMPNREIDEWFDAAKQNEMIEAKQELGRIGEILLRAKQFFEPMQEEIEKLLSFRFGEEVFEGSKAEVQEINDKLEGIQRDAEELMSKMNESLRENEIADERVKEALTLSQAVSGKDRELQKSIGSFRDTVTVVDRMVKDLNGKYDEYDSKINEFEGNVSFYISRLKESRKQIREMERMIRNAGTSSAVNSTAIPSSAKNFIKSVKTKSARGRSIAFVLVSD